MVVIQGEMKAIQQQVHGIYNMEKYQEKYANIILKTWLHRIGRFEILLYFLMEACKKSSEWLSNFREDVFSGLLVTLISSFG